MTTCQRLVSVGIFKLILLSMQINIYCLSNDKSNACIAGTTPFANESNSDVGTVPLFFSNV